MNFFVNSSPALITTDPRTYTNKVMVVRYTIDITMHIVPLMIVWPIAEIWQMSPALSYTII